MNGRRRRLGQWGESLAVRYLETHKCQVVASNWRCQAGEVDIVVRDGDCLAFVEVRTRRGDAYGTPEESITPRKLARMAAIAEAYVQEEGWKGPWRLDVIAIRAGGRGDPSVEWYKNVTS